MFQRLKNRISDRKMLRSGGTRTSVQYCLIVNNDDIQYFPSYESALDYLSHYRKVNQVFNLSVFRIEFYSLISDLTSKID